MWGKIKPYDIDPLARYDITALAFLRKLFLFPRCFPKRGKRGKSLNNTKGLFGLTQNKGDGNNEFHQNQ